jgi:hypothetical protein
MTSSSTYHMYPWCTILSMAVFFPSIFMSGTMDPKYCPKVPCICNGRLCPNEKCVQMDIFYGIKEIRCYPCASASIPRVFRWTLDGTLTFPRKRGKMAGLTTTESLAPNPSKEWTIHGQLNRADCWCIPLPTRATPPNPPGTEPCSSTVRVLCHPYSDICTPIAMLEEEAQTKDVLYISWTILSGAWHVFGDSVGNANYPKWMMCLSIFFYVFRLWHCSFALWFQMTNDDRLTSRTYSTLALFTFPYIVVGYISVDWQVSHFVGFH